MKRCAWLFGCVTVFLMQVGAVAGAAEPKAANPFRATPVSGVWWSPAESGWGLAIQRNAENTIFAVLFIYDEQGRATWYVMPDGKPQGDAVQGDAFQPTGPSYTNPVFDSAQVNMGDPVGTFRVALERGMFEFTINGIHSVKSIEPFLGNGNGEYTGVWWNPLEGGWGLARHDTFTMTGPFTAEAMNFGALFVYGEDGRPTWFIMPDGQQIASIDTYTSKGAAYRPSGPPLAATFDSARVNVGPPVGRFDFYEFVTMQFSYRLPGASAQKPLQRFKF